MRPVPMRRTEKGEVWPCQKSVLLKAKEGETEADTLQKQIAQIEGRAARIQQP